MNCAVEALVTAGLYREALEALGELHPDDWQHARFLRIPGWELPKINAAEALSEMGRVDEARRMLDEVDSGEPSHAIVSTGSSVHRAWIDARYADAAAALGAVEAVDPARLGSWYQSEWHFTRASALLGLRRYEDALAAVRAGRDKAVRISSERNGLFLEARIRLAQGDAEAAARSAEAAALHPYRGQGGDGLLVWGDALLALGKRDAAAEAWKRVLARDPQSVAALAALERLGRIHLPMNTGTGRAPEVG